MSALQPLLEPASVAIIGASSDPEKSGGVLLRALQGGGYPGRIYPINPRAQEIGGLQCYASITAVPEPVDLAFVVIRRDLVAAAIDDCAAAGVRAAAIITAGFGEADAWGKAEQERIAETIRTSGMLVIGPNTIGLITMGSRHTGSFVSFPKWQDGPIGIVAQSGIFAGAVAQDEMERDVQRLGVKSSVSVGNRVGVTETALLTAYGADPDIQVIGCYLESFADGRRFLAEAARVKCEKPVIVLKPGRTAGGAKAAASHTGSLATDDVVVDQLLADHGVIRAADEEQFVALLKSFSYAPLPAGRRLGIVTFSGAMGVIASDLATDAGLELPDYADETLARIAALLPDWQPVRNPADLWPAIDIDRREALLGGLRAALEDPGVDQVLGILLAVPNADFEGFREGFAQLRADFPDKPFQLVLRGAVRESWTRQLEGLAIPIHASLRIAVDVMAAAARYAEARELSPSAHLDSELDREVELADL